MRPGLHLRHSPVLRMTQVMQRAVGLLRLDDAELAGLLIEEAAENPALRIALPMPRPEPPRGWRVLGDLAGREAFDGDAVEARAAGLHAHVLAQLGTIFRDPGERALAAAFAAALEPSGWLGGSVADLAREAKVPEARAEQVLARLQAEIEPAGLFARSLAECLAPQLRDRDALDPPMRVLLAHLPELARGEAAFLCTRCGVDAAELGRRVRLLRSLDPKPGTGFDTAPELRRAPDLLLDRDAAGEWQVELNHASAPRLRLAELAAPASPEAQVTARWLSRTLGRRNEILLRVAGHAVAHQRAFLEKGPAWLRPLTNAEAGAALGLHETTVGRVRAGLLVQAPRGVFALDTLFARGRIPCRDGAVSGAALTAMIGELIRNEPPEAPLTDMQIAAALERRGVRLSRRTLSNWRRRAGFAPAERRGKKGKNE